MSDRLNRRLDRIEKCRRTLSKMNVAPDDKHVSAIMQRMVKHADVLEGLAREVDERFPE